MDSGEISIKEERIRKITHLYYSRPEIKKVLYEFSKAGRFVQDILKDLENVQIY
jgi:hypothetical protein